MLSVCRWFQNFPDNYQLPRSTPLPDRPTQNWAVVLGLWYMIFYGIICNCKYWTVFADDIECSPLQEIQSFKDEWISTGQPTYNPSIQTPKSLGVLTRVQTVYQALFPCNKGNPHSQFTCRLKHYYCSCWLPSVATCTSIRRVRCRKIIIQVGSNKQKQL